MNGDVEREYEYKPSWSVIIFVAVFFSSGAVFLYLKTVKSDRGLIIEGIIPLGPTGATLFFGALTLLSVGFVLLAAFLAYMRIVHRQRIAFTSDALIVPAPMGRGEMAIPYRSISGLSMIEVNWQRILYVSHTGGQASITASMLPSMAIFKEVCALIAAKVQESRMRNPTA
jgi:hypothetical protein